jgi:transcriptional regulator with XRE-family HTH domain
VKRTSKPSSSSASKTAVVPTGTLADLIKRKGIKLATIAAKLGISTPMLSYVSNGRQPLNAAWIKPLAKALGESERDVELLYWASVEHLAEGMLATAAAEKSRIRAGWTLLVSTRVVAAKDRAPIPA